MLVNQHLRQRFESRSHKPLSHETILRLFFGILLIFEYQVHHTSTYHVGALKDDVQGVFLDFHLEINARIAGRSAFFQAVRRFA